MKRIASAPTPTETSTRAEESLYFRRARMPSIKAAIVAEKMIGAVMSHQRSLDESQLGVFKSRAEIPAPAKKNVCNPTDHLPTLVSGNIFINFRCRILWRQIFSS